MGEKHVGKSTCVPPWEEKPKEALQRDVSFLLSSNVETSYLEVRIFWVLVYSVPHSALALTNRKFKMESVGINILNDYCLLEIFKRLGFQDRLTTQTVCRRWDTITQIYRRELCPDKYEIENNIVALSHDQQVEEVTTILKFCGDHLKTISCKNAYDEGDFSTEIMSVIAKYCPNLVTLNLYNVPLYSKDFDLLSKSCVQIQSLRLGGEYSSYLIEVVEFARKSNALKEITFERSEFECELISDRVFWNVEKIIIQYCIMKKIRYRQVFNKPASVKSMIPLTHLAIRECKNMFDLDLYYISIECQYLTHLLISYSRAKYRGMHYILTKRHLEELVLEEQHMLTDKVFFCDFKPTLMYVGLYNCFKIRGPGVLRLIRGSPRLRKLELLGCGVDCDAQFLQKVAHAVKERHGDEELNLTVEVSNGQQKLHIFHSR